jgi:hypothetical protein
MATTDKTADGGRLDRLIAESRREREQREQGYREQALKLYPWVCGRCGRSFDRSSVHQLSVHHRDHNHDNNPIDGSNWELLCLYCHDNEHQRQLEAADDHHAPRPEASHKPFSDLSSLLKKKP